MAKASAPPASAVQPCLTSARLVQCCPGGVGASLEKRESDGWYGQLTYKFQDVKVGYSYGQSNLKIGGQRNGIFTNGNLLKQNASNVVGVYYALTKSLNLVGEWVNTESKAQTVTSTTTTLTSWARSCSSKPEA